MDNNFIKVYGAVDNPYLIDLLNGIEEQGIKYEILPLEKLNTLNLAKVPFNLAVVLKDDYFKLRCNDFGNKIKFMVKVTNKKIAKEFGLDVGRYIKRIPLKGEWYE